MNLMFTALASTPFPSPHQSSLAERLLEPWWADLDGALHTDQYCDLNTVHRLE